MRYVRRGMLAALGVVAGSLLFELTLRVGINDLCEALCRREIFD